MLTLIGFQRQSDGSYKMSASKLFARLTWFGSMLGLGYFFK